MTSGWANMETVTQEVTAAEGPSASAVSEMKGLARAQE